MSARLRILLGELQQSERPRQCGRACRLATTTREQLPLLAAFTTVGWRWQIGEPSVKLVTFCKQAEDCDCLIELVGELVIEALGGAQHGRHVAAASADLIRFAFGPGRAVFVEVRSPDYPTWFPMEYRC